ncbi:2-hydroxychromene-2-carboxylate isomerase [Dinoroseobacter sp. S76]|uniref:2-hydroxychromene-2-carboxylate isomerase n=1 Tax=Dinoroseobacter sp. S76 TaxID=3415124 RepID=UPI003C7C43AA
MAGKLTFWFELASTYTYLSAMRIDAMAEDAGVEVIWRPVPLGPIFGGQGWDTSPFNIYPAKGRYMWRDMERLCAARGLPFAKPDPFPQNSIHAARVALAALETNKGRAFCKAVYTAQFARGANIAERAVLEAALIEVGLPADLVEAAADSARKAELKACSIEAAELGLFGAPSFTVGDELYWGDDRLEEALAFAAAQPA